METEDISFEECLSAKTAMMEEYHDLHSLSFDSISSTGSNWSNITYSGQNVALVSKICENVGGRFSAFATVIFNCSFGMEAVTNMAECFPTIEACADISATDFMIKVLNKITECTLQSQIPLDAVPELGPTTPYPTRPPTVSPSPTTLAGPYYDDDTSATPFDDTNRGGCMQEMNDLLQSDPALEKAAEQHEATVVRTNKFGVGGWQNITAPASNTFSAYQEACAQAHGRFVVFTGIFDCSPIPGKYPPPGTGMAFTNYAQCFASGPFCNSYTSVGDYWIDFYHVWSYDCKIVSQGDESDSTGLATQGTLSPPSVTMSVAPAVQPTLAAAPAFSSSPPPAPGSAGASPVFGTSSGATDGAAPLIPLLVVMVVGLMFAIVFIAVRRRTQGKRAFSAVQPGFCELTNLDLDEDEDDQWA